MICYRKKAISGSHILKVAVKKTSYNEGRLYFKEMKGLNVYLIKLYSFKGFS